MSTAVLNSGPAVPPPSDSTTTNNTRSRPTEVTRAKKVRFCRGKTPRPIRHKSPAPNGGSEKRKKSPAASGGIRKKSPAAGVNNNIKSKTNSKSQTKKNGPLKSPSPQSNLSNSQSKSQIQDSSQTVVPSSGLDEGLLLQKLNALEEREEKMKQERRNLQLSLKFAAAAAAATAEAESAENCGKGGDTVSPMRSGAVIEGKKKKKKNLKNDNKAQGASNASGPRITNIEPTTQTINPSDVNHNDVSFSDLDNSHSEDSGLQDSHRPSVDAACKFFSIDDSPRTLRMRQSEDPIGSWFDVVDEKEGRGGETKIVDHLGQISDHSRNIIKTDVNDDEDDDEDEEALDSDSADVDDDSEEQLVSQSEPEEEISEVASHDDDHRSYHEHDLDNDDASSQCTEVSMHVVDCHINGSQQDSDNLNSPSNNSDIDLDNLDNDDEYAVNSDDSIDANSYNPTGGPGQNNRSGKASSLASSASLGSLYACETPKSLGSLYGSEDGGSPQEEEQEDESHDNVNESKLKKPVTPTCVLNLENLAAHNAALNAANESMKDRVFLPRSVALQSKKKDLTINLDQKDQNQSQNQSSENNNVNEEPGPMSSDSISMNLPEKNDSATEVINKQDQVIQKFSPVAEETQTINKIEQLEGGPPPRRNSTNSNGSRVSQTSQPKISLSNLSLDNDEGCQHLSLTQQQFDLSSKTTTTGSTTTTSVVAVAPGFHTGANSNGNTYDIHSYQSSKESIDTSSDQQNNLMPSYIDSVTDQDNINIVTSESGSDSKANITNQIQNQNHLKFPSSTNLLVSPTSTSMTNDTTKTTPLNTSTTNWVSIPSGTIVVEAELERDDPVYVVNKQQQNPEPIKASPLSQSSLSQLSMSGLLQCPPYTNYSSVLLATDIKTVETSESEPNIDASTPTPALEGHRPPGSVELLD